MTRTFYNYLIVGFFFAIVSFFFSACSSESKQSTNQSDGKISLNIFEQKLKEIDAPQLIDVRTPEEFSKGHLPNAKNINYNAATFEDQINQLDKNKTVFIYCQSGGRSGKAYKKMKAQGFTTVYDMKGGYGAYSKK